MLPCFVQNRGDSRMPQIAPRQNHAADGASPEITPPIQIFLIPILFTHNSIHTPPHPKSRSRSIVRRLATQLPARHFPHRMPPIRSSPPRPACSLVETTRAICSDPGPPLFSGRILGTARVQRPEEFLGETEARRRALFSGSNGAASGPVLGGAIGRRRVRFRWSRTRHPDLERSLRPGRAVATADPA